MPCMIQPSSRTFVAFCAAAVLLLCDAGFIAPASAQTGAELLVVPFEKDQNFEINGSVLFQQTGKDDFGSGGDLRVNVYESSGRAREVREKSIPRIGYDVTYLDINSDRSF